MAGVLLQPVLRTLTGDGPRTKSTSSSQVELAAQMLTMLVAAFGGRVVHGVGDAAFHGESLPVAGSTWTTRRRPSNGPCRPGS